MFQNKIRIKIVVCLFFIISSSSIYSQYSFGIKSGLNFSNVKGNINDDTKTGVYLGAFSIIKINDKFNFQPEIVYSEQGYRLGSYTKNKYHINYVNIPLMFDFKDFENFHLEFGPQLGFLLKSNVNNEMDLKEITSKIDFGISVGFNAYMCKQLFLNLRYNQGFLNFNRQPDTQLNLRHSVISFGVGYVFYKK